MRKRILSYIWAFLIVLSMTMLTTGVTANAASQKAVKSVTVRADKKNITKKTYALEIGKSKSLKVSASPKRAVTSIRYKSNKPKIVAVSKKGKLTAKKKGTAKIQITVTGKDKKKRSTWVKIKAENPAVKSVSVMIDSRNVTGKEYSLERGGWKDLKVNAAPAKAVKSIQFASGNTRVASVDQKGTVVARNAGTARITVTALNKDNKKKSAWVTIKVTESKPNPQPDPTPTIGENKILVAYFSATNTTEKIAGYIANELPADLYEIVPEIPYTSADLNYGDSSSRTSIEMNDPNSRPAISGSVENMGQYETVFLGYPIWWGEAPRIINTFLESYDFSGKTIIPFCTSGSSGIGSSATNLHSLANGADWRDGRRFGGSASRSDVATWVNSLDLNLNVMPDPTPNPEPTPDPEPTPERKEIPIKITIGDTALNGVIYDTELAEEIKGHFPLTVSMSAYGGREYYGGLGFTPESSRTGQLNFENGDITYCRTNNTMAIFYAQTDRPNLTMEVVPIGKVTSDLSVFDSLGSREDITFSLAGEETNGDVQEKNRILVAYFSATNTTERLAGFLADGLPSDLYEIVPEIPYTSADLNYGDSSSRTSIEMNDPDARPAISGSVEDMGQYDMVFLGYPIWWGEAPRIISTFLKSYDFSGKTIIPFCTSGSSGIGSSATRLHGLTDGAEWLSGRRFGSSATQGDMLTWVNGLGLDFTVE